MTRNAARFSRFLLVVLAILGLGALLALAVSCGNYPLEIYRDVIIHGNSAVTGNASVGGTVTADHLEADNADIGGVTIDDGSITVPEDVNVGGQVIQVPPPPPPQPPPPPAPPPTSSVCGNGVVELGEQCDGFNFNGQTCLTHGFDGGILVCLADCTVNFGQCMIIVPPPPVPIPEPEILTATIKSTGDKTIFDLGELIQYEVTATGGLSPWDLRCLRPDGQFIVVNGSAVSHFEFSFRINSPGSGTINCRVSSGDGQEADVWAAITVQ